MDPDACYIGCAGTVHRCSKAARDPQEAAWLWEWASKSVGVPASAQLMRR